MNYLFKIFICVTLLCSAVSSKAQVRGVQFALAYNSLTNLFDCFLYVKEGSAQSTIERIQFNAQFSLVVPTGSTVEVRETHMPLVDNQLLKGVLPIKWAITSKLSSPQIAPDIDLYGITPNLAPAGFYNELEEGDFVKLFSVAVEAEALDYSQVRIFDNQKDPKSYQIGMKNGDFSNGFTMGGYLQLYKGIKDIGLTNLN